MDPEQTLVDLLLATEELAERVSDVRDGTREPSAMHEPYQAALDARRALYDWVSKGGYEPNALRATDKLAMEIQRQAEALYHERTGNAIPSAR